MIVSSKTWCEIGLRRVYFLWIFFVGWPVLHFITIKSFPVAICTNYLFLILLVDQRDFLLGSFYWFCGFLCHGFNGRLIHKWDFLFEGCFQVSFGSYFGKLPFPTALSCERSKLEYLWSFSIHMTLDFKLIYLWLDILEKLLQRNKRKS